MSDTKRSSCEHGDCAEHCSDPTAWCDKCFGKLVQADPRLTTMYEPTTTTVSDPRPASALEQTLSGYAQWATENAQNAPMERIAHYREGMAEGYQSSARMAHERDAPLFKLLHYCEHTATAPALTDGAEFTKGYKTALADIAEELHNILEGKTS